MDNKNEIKTEGINNDVNFWNDAEEFLKTQLPDNFQDNLLNFVKDRKYNRNEVTLFNKMLADKIGFHGTMVLIKNYI